MLTEDIQRAIKSDNIIIGYKESIKFIKTGSPKIIIVAKNIPEKMKKEIEHNAKISKVKLEIYEGSSGELGVICGKPFPVTTLVIKG
jgi:large subunit ribosomal protein L30e